MIYTFLTVANAVYNVRKGVDSYSQCTLRKEETKLKACEDLIKLDKLSGGYWFFQELINSAIKSTNEANCDYLLRTQQKNCVSEAVYDSAVNFIGMELSGFAVIGIAHGVGYTASCIASGVYYIVNFIHDHLT